MPLLAGTRLGSYEIEGRPDGSDAGEVYRAHDTRLDRTVAIELLSPDDTPRSADFEREARVLSRLRHPRIGALLDVGETDGTPYVVREWVEGRTLATRLREGALPLAEALQCGLEIAEALDGGHRQGIPHGRLTSGGVALTDRGVKLLDYGRERLTRRGPGAGDGADMQADISALGALLTEMLVGARSLERQRWTSAGDALQELRLILEQQRASNAPPPAVTPLARRRWLVATLLGAAVAGALAYVVEGLR